MIDPEVNDTLPLLCQMTIYLSHIYSITFIISHEKDYFYFIFCCIIFLM